VRPHEGRAMNLRLIRMEWTVKWSRVVAAVACVTIGALAWDAIMHPDGFSGTAFLTVMVFVLLFAVCKAFAGRGVSRASWSAFAVVGIVYDLFTLSGVDEYLTTELIEWLRQRYGEVLFAPPAAWGPARIYSFERVGQGVCTLVLTTPAALLTRVLYRHEEREQRQEARS